MLRIRVILQSVAVGAATTSALITLLYLALTIGRRVHFLSIDLDGALEKAPVVLVLLVVAKVVGMTVTVVTVYLLAKYSEVQHVIAVVISYILLALFCEHFTQRLQGSTIVIPHYYLLEYSFMILSAATTYGLLRLLNIHKNR